MLAIIVSFLSKNGYKNNSSGLARTAQKGYNRFVISEYILLGIYELSWCYSTRAVSFLGLKNLCA